MELWRRRRLGGRVELWGGRGGQCETGGNGAVWDWGEGVVWEGSSVGLGVEGSSVGLGVEGGSVGLEVEGGGRGQCGTEGKGAVGRGQWGDWGGAEYFF